MNHQNKKLNIKAIAPDLAKVPTNILEHFFDLMALEKDMAVTKALLKELVLSYSTTERELRATLRERDYLLDVLKRDLAEASEYVKSTLPEPISDGIVHVDWRFIPAATVGGDSFGYHFLDDDHFVVYLLDVSGHGVGAALLSVSVINLLRTQSLPEIDFHMPDQVVGALNKAFPGEKNDYNHFSIWYGVYNKRNHSLEYCSAGHPPALLLFKTKEGKPHIVKLSTRNPAIGIMTDINYKTDICIVDESKELFVFSDGVYEITKKDGSVWRFDEFADSLGQIGVLNADLYLDKLIEYVKALKTSDQFDDDFTILKIGFNRGT